MANGHQRCGWCEKSAREVELLIEGNGCFICDECAELCVKIVQDIRNKKQARAELAAKEKLRPVFTAQDLQLRWFVENELSTVLTAQFGEGVYQSWFASMEFENIADGEVYLSVPIKFIQRWVQQHFAEALLDGFAKRFTYVRSICVGVRRPGLGSRRARDHDKPSPDKQ